MIYSEIELKKMSKKNLSAEEHIKFNILNFIRTIHLNKQDFINTSYGTEFYGEIPMTFRKKEGQVIGFITARVDGELKKYVFNDQGYESLDDY